MAERAGAFGMEVGFHDPDVSRAAAPGQAARSFPSLPALLDWADFLSIHAPLTSATRGSVGEEAFERLGTGGILVNVARGAIVDEAALLRALASGQLAAAGLDVLATEPTVPEPLRHHPRVLLTAHSAWYSDPVLPELRREAARQARLVLRGEAPTPVAQG